MSRLLYTHHFCGIMIFIFLQFSTTHSCVCQNGEEMLISQIDGNRYIRKDFDKNHRLKEYQSIEIGKTVKVGNKLEIEMTVTMYDKSGKSKGTSQSTLVCTPESKQVIIGLFPFAAEKSKKSIEAKMDQNSVMYPSNWRQLAKLPDFNFKLNFKGGAAGFLGTKSDVSIFNRNVTQQGGVYSVSGSITMKAYAFGLKIATIKYEYSEKIDDLRGIVQQIFTAKSGDYFTMEIDNSSK